MKRSSIIITGLFLAVVFAVPVMAQGIGWARGGRMMGFQGVPWGFNPVPARGNDNLTSEQREKLEKARKTFIDGTTDLRNNLRTKVTELANLLSSAEPDANKAKALQKEISDLQANLAQKRLELRLEVLKINPDARYGHGQGRRTMMGFGPGMGFGRGMGFGPGMGLGQQ